MFPAPTGGVAISRLFKRLFTGLTGSSGTASGVTLGAFGKHPAFDDHLEDPGLASPALVDARRILYADAIRAIIDAGTWERLEPGQRLDGFDHTFLWSLTRADDILLTGRLIPSRDAKGRDKYPLVLCAEIRSPGAPGAVPTAIRRLDALAEECATAQTRADFVAAVDAARASASTILFLSEERPSAIEIVEGFRKAGADAEECFARCLYALQRELSPVANRQTASGTGHVRLPLPDGMADAPSLCGWLAIIRRWMPDLPGTLLIKPRTQPWIDALVPIPLPAQLACIRSAASLVPLACDVPYNLDPRIIQQARELASSLK